MYGYPRGYDRGYGDAPRYRRIGRFYDFREGEPANDHGYDAGFERGYGRRGGMYSADYRGEGWGRPFRYRYDEEYRFRPGYGERPKSAWQTNYGDPFGDRQRRTPMRVVRRRQAPDPRRPDLTIPYGRDYEAWGAAQPYWRVDPRTGYLLD